MGPSAVDGGHGGGILTGGGGDGGNATGGSGGVLVIEDNDATTTTVDGNQTTVGDIDSDLSGPISGGLPPPVVGDGALAGLRKYSTHLRSMTQGRGMHGIRFSATKRFRAS